MSLCAVVRFPKPVGKRVGEEGVLQPLFKSRKIIEGKQALIFNGVESTETFKYMGNKYSVDNVAMLKTVPFKSKVIVNCCFEQSP